jgi:hypothetical protein
MLPPALPSIFAFLTRRTQRIRSIIGLKKSPPIKQAS